MKDEFFYTYDLVEDDGFKLHSKIDEIGRDGRKIVSVVWRGAGERASPDESKGAEFIIIAEIIPQQK